MKATRLWRANGRAVVAGFITLAALPLFSNAQTPISELKAGRELTPILAGGERSLFLIDTGIDEAAPFRCGVDGEFVDLPVLHASVRAAVQGGNNLYVFSGANDFYSLRGNDWVREVDLPQKAAPSSLVAAGSGIYALAISPPPSTLAEYSATQPATGPASSRPFNPGLAVLSVLRYDGNAWTGVVPAPPIVSAGFDDSRPRLRPRLAYFRGGLHLLWLRDTRQLMMISLNLEQRRWEVPQSIDLPVEPTGFWVTQLGEAAPALLIAYRTRAAEAAPESETESLRAMQLLPVAGTTAEQWVESTLKLTEPLASNDVSRILACLAFNQQLALLANDRQGKAWLAFARLDGPPTAAARPIRKIIAAAEAPRQIPIVFSTITLLVMIAVLAALFVMRRNSMLGDLQLPPDCAAGFVFQRTLALGIDFAPIALILAAIQGVDWRSGLEALWTWVWWTGNQPPRQFPSITVLTWWGLSSGVYTLYCLIAELTVGRTLGKKILGTRILSENGAAPRPFQILIRNAFRMIELLPPMWALAALVLLSRNRQRVGDLFARTVVVRRRDPQERTTPREDPEP